MKYSDMGRVMSFCSGKTTELSGESRKDEKLAKLMVSVVGETRAADVARAVDIAVDTAAASGRADCAVDEDANLAKRVFSPSSSRSD